jgi:5-methylcytosine-specific restriction protein A
VNKSNWHTSSAHSRGYDAEWRKVRKIVLQRDNGLCQCDECQGGKKRLTAANEVHHIVSKARAKAMGWTRRQMDDMDNLQSVNSECHKRITAAEQGRTIKPKVEIGLDGFPRA